MDRLKVKRLIFLRPSSWLSGPCYAGGLQKHAHFGLPRPAALIMSRSAGIGRRAVLLWREGWRMGQVKGSAYKAGYLYSESKFGLTIHCCSCCCHRSEHAPPSSNAYLQPPDLTERMGSRPGAWQQSLHAVSKGEGGRQVERVLTLYLGHPDYPVLRPLFGTSRLETSTHPTLPSFLIPSPGHEPSLHAAHAASASSLLPLPTWLGRINLGNKEKTLQV